MDTSGYLFMCIPLVMDARGYLFMGLYVIPDLIWNLDMRMQKDHSYSKRGL
jgi:hypothetical protein